LFEETSLQLQNCRKDLDKAEEERTAALVYSTEVEALRERLSQKEQEVLDLTSELSERKRELRLQDKLREGSSRGETHCKRCSKFDIPGVVLRFY